MRDGNPATARDVWQPHVVGAIGWKVIGVSFYAKSRVPQDRGKLQAKIAIGEEDDTQATRS